MGIFVKLYPQVVERLKSAAHFHGSWCRDIFIEFAQGRFAVDNHAERIITELVEEGQVKISERSPTPSQAAFAGLQYDTKQPWGPGTVEHYRYEWLSKK